METIKITYEFSNKVTADIIYQDSETSPSIKCEWSCDFTKKNIAPIWDEYVNQCVPRVYQEISNLSGRVITWMDSSGKAGIMVFEPQTNG